MCDPMGRPGSGASGESVNDLSVRTFSACGTVSLGAYNGYANHLEVTADINVSALGTLDPNIGIIVNNWGLDPLGLGTQSLWYNYQPPNSTIGNIDGYYYVPNNATGPGPFDLSAGVHVLSSSATGTRTLELVLHRNNESSIINRDVEFPSPDPTVPTSLKVQARHVILDAGDLITVNFLHTAAAGANVHILPGDTSYFTVKKDLLL